MSIVSDILFLENETTMLSQNIVHQLPTDPTPHPRGTDVRATYSVLNEMRE